MGDIDKQLYILREAGAAKARTGMQKFGADALVHTEGSRYLVNIGADVLTKGLDSCSFSKISSKISYCKMPEYLLLSGSEGMREESSWSRRLFLQIIVNLSSLDGAVTANWPTAS